MYSGEDFGNQVFSRCLKNVEIFFENERSNSKNKNKIYQQNFDFSIVHAEFNDQGAQKRTQLMWGDSKLVRSEVDAVF